jgi:hypothetical protein
MFRIHPVAIALFCAIAACSPAPQSSAGAPSGPAIQAANQDAPAPEITGDTIVRDVVGRVVKITEVRGDSPPTDWRFEADEFKQVEILEREVTPTAATITVLMTTRNNPGPDEESVQVSGKLRLHYLRKGGYWVLTTIENLTFRYTIGIST